MVEPVYKGGNIPASLNVLDDTTPFDPVDVRLLVVSPTLVETEYEYGVSPQIVKPALTTGLYEAYIPTDNDGVWNLIWEIVYPNDTATVTVRQAKSYAVHPIASPTW